MVFSEHVFLLLFLPACLAVFYVLRAAGWFRASVLALVIFSFVFYGYWSPIYLGLLIVTIGANYAMGLFLYRRGQGLAGRVVLILGVAFNLSLIVWFKYAGFLVVDVVGIRSFEDFFRGILLPIGISFFTFQQVAYLVDARARRTYEPSLLNYAMFIAFFPQLIAGPVVNHRYVETQFADLGRGRIDVGIIRFGAILFVIGLAKKVFVADVIGRDVDPMFAATLEGGQLAAWQAWLMVSAYRLQLYFDFSGYSDMAIGLAAMFGLRMPINFNSPYKSKSIAELWGRWHMSLSSFVRDYVYIPLGGNRHGRLNQLRNIFIGMFLIGIWHGAAWTFVVYALMMASAVCLNHATRFFWPAFSAWNTPLALVLKQTACLAFYFGTGAFFRAENMTSALSVWWSLVGLGQGAAIALPTPDPVFLVWCAAALVITLAMPNALQIVRYTPRLDQAWPTDPDAPVAPKEAARPDYVHPIRWRLERHAFVPFLCGLVLALCLAAGWRPAIFLYFNF